MGELIRLAPGLANSYPEIPKNPPLEPKSQQRRLVESMVTFCQTLSARSPLLLVVEDLHWADGDTLSLLHTLARRTRPNRVMLLGTYRDTDIEAGHPFNQVLVRPQPRAPGNRVQTISSEPGADGGNADFPLCRRDHARIPGRHLPRNRRQSFFYRRGLQGLDRKRSAEI